MISQEPLPFIKKYLEIINHGLKIENPSYELTRTQMLWLGFCLMGILLSNSVCWAKFERLSLKSYTQQALSWMFRHSKIKWDSILRSSVKSILAQYGITNGILIIDDKDHGRSKNARKLHRLHKIKDKKNRWLHPWSKYHSTLSRYSESELSCLFLLLCARPIMV